MAFWCIDPTNGSDSTGASHAVQATAETTPYKTLAGVEAEGSPPAAGDSILWQGGQTILGVQAITTATVGSSGSQITLGSYGTGKAKFDANGSVSAVSSLTSGSALATYLTFYNLDISGGEGASSECLRINSYDNNLGIPPTDNEPVYNVIDSCYIHDTALADGIGSGGDGQGIDCRASNVEIKDTTIIRVSDDGIYNHGNDVEVHHCTISLVDLSVEEKSGDSLKFSSAGLCTNAHAHHNILDHSNNGRKHPLIMAGGGTGQIGEHNLCKGGEFGISVKGSGAIARRNLVQPTIPLHPNNGSVSITVTKGINVEESNVVIESNIVDTTVLGVPTHAVQSVSGNTNTFQGNVIFGEVETAAGNNASLRFNAGTGHIIRNNIMGRGDGSANLYHISCATAVTFAYCDYNIYLEDSAFRYTDGVGGTTFYADFNTWKTTNPGGFDAHSSIVSATTLFRDAANGDFRLKDGQALIGAAADYKDFLGDRNFPPVIGAYRVNTLTNRTQTTARSTTTARSSSTSRATRDIQYPIWGDRN